MKHLGKHIASALAAALLIVGFGTTQVYAQDDVAARTEQLKESWEAAVTAYQARDFSTAYTNFERAARIGAQLEDPTAKETAQRANQYLPRVAYAEGLQNLQSGNHQAAVAAFDKGLSVGTFSRRPTNERTVIMKHLGKHIASALAAALLIVGFGTTQVYAQDDVAARTEQLKESWEAAVTAYQARDFSTAYTNFERAARIGAQLEDPTAKETAQRANQYLPRVAYAEGLQNLQSGNHQAAVAAFDKGLSVDSSYVNNMLGKGMAYQRMDRADDALGMYVRALNSGKTAGDSDVARRAEEAIRSHFQPLASAQLAQDNAGARQARAAIEYLEQMQEYVEPDANTYFYLASAHNLLGEHERAVALLNQGLEMHTGSRRDKARFYFEKGEALRYMGNIAEAKEAYRNAAFGSYKQPAEHFIETL